VAGGGTSQNLCEQRAKARRISKKRKVVNRRRRRNDVDKEGRAADLSGKKKHQFFSPSEKKQRTNRGESGLAWKGKAASCASQKGRFDQAKNGVEQEAYNGFDHLEVRWCSAPEKKKVLGHY